MRKIIIFGNSGSGKSTLATALVGFPDPDLAIPDVPAANYFSLGGGWQVNPSLTLRFVVNNLLDKDPPNMASAVWANNTDSSLYDVFGRSYYLSLAWQPGQ